MRDLPVRRLKVSDFRRIEGTRVFPLDAPIVLIHGPNGSGKTSMLSALELALTGSIRSMEQSATRYRSHLPFFGQPYASVQVDVAKDLRGGSPGHPLIVGDSGVEGNPALKSLAAQFYAERCYLDQASLGRLLDLYQDREESKGSQSALEKFVTGLLGLEKLDALRDGLRDALDLRLLKKFAVGVDEADREAKTAAAKMKDQIARVTECQSELANVRAALRETIAGLGHDAPKYDTDQALLEFANRWHHNTRTHAELESAKSCQFELLALSGRVSAFLERPTSPRVDEVRVALTDATTRRKDWEIRDALMVHTWEAGAEAAGIHLQLDLRTAVERAVIAAEQELQGDSDLRTKADTVRRQRERDQEELGMVQTRLAEAHEHSSALVNSLTAARAMATESNICAVCDRDFADTGSHTLLAHIDSKLADLTIHGQQLVELRDERDRLVARVARADVELAQVTSTLLSQEQRQSTGNRLASLSELAMHVGDIEAAKAEGIVLERAERKLHQTLEDLESATAEETRIGSEIAKYADLLKIEVPGNHESFQAAVNELQYYADAHVSRLNTKAEQGKKAEEHGSHLKLMLDQESMIASELVEVTENKKLWEGRFAEAKRRQGVAKNVHDAVTKARTDIVHRVFTESLNDVWKSVFTRLAPDERFIPRFGIPNATKKSFDIELETLHRDGETSGPPQMMLSAGNLNTAALSLFIALHLAVEPVVPCLVFDDPVQAMDEVHVAQFAALIRLLSKQHDRQIVIAVHERELFDYLALELSPAYKGDELITIELGERATDEDQGITRHVWEPDIAIAN